MGIINVVDFFLRQHESYDRGKPAISYKWTGWVWEITIEVQDYMKIIDHLKGIFKIYPNLIKENWRMSTCNRPDLETLGSQPIYAPIYPITALEFFGYQILW